MKDDGASRKRIPIIEIIGWIVPLWLRSRLSIDVQAWLFGEFITGVHRSAMMMDNLGLDVVIEDKPEPPEGA